MDGVLDLTASLMGGSPAVAVCAAFVGGVLTSFTPCSLSGASLAIAYVGGVEQKGTAKSLRLSLVFALGSALAFVALGVAASTVGAAIGSAGQWVYVVLGVLMLLMALQTLGFVSLVPSSNLVSKNDRRGYAGALLVGVLSALFSSPCSTPVLIALLAAVAGSGSVAWSAAMLLAYALGHSVLSVVAGTSTGFVRSLSRSERYGRASKAVSIVLGVAIGAVGVYLIYIGL